MRLRLLRWLRDHILTPTTFATVAAAALLLAGHPLPAGALLVCVGWGGLGQAFYKGVQDDCDPWNWFTVLEAAVETLLGQHPTMRWGIVFHLPQAVAGLFILLRGG